MAKLTISEIVRTANRSEIARRTGLSLSGVSRILSGDRTPEADNLRMLADELDVSMDDLFAHLVKLRSRRQSNVAA